MEMEQLKLSTYVNLCLQIDDSGDEEAQKDLEDFLSKLVVRNYMPLSEKNIRGIEIMRLLHGEYDAPGLSTMLAIYTCMNGLFAYAVNLEDDLSSVSYTLAVYDKIVEFGLYDSIRRVCANDYQRFIEFINNMLDIANIQQLLQTASLFSDQEYDKWVTMMQKLEDTLTPDVIEAVTKFSVAKNLSETGVAETLTEKVLDDLKQQKLNSNIKLKSILDDIDDNMDTSMTSNMESQPSIESEGIENEAK